MSLGIHCGMQEHFATTGPHKTAAQIQAQQRDLMSKLPEVPGVISVGWSGSWPHSSRSIRKLVGIGRSALFLPACNALSLLHAN